MTISRVLNENGIYSYSKKKKPKLTKIQKIKRKKFCEKYLFFTIEDWSEVLFTDESPFLLYSKNGNQKVWRTKGTELEENNIQTMIKHGPKINIWASMSYEGVGSIHLINGIMDSIQYAKILDKYLRNDGIQLCGESFILMQDNDPKHNSRLVSNWLDDHLIPALDWPPNSPDLNPIENLFSFIKKELKKIEISNSKDLWEKVQDL